MGKIITTKSIKKINAKDGTKMERTTTVTATSRIENNAAVDKKSGLSVEVVSFGLKPYFEKGEPIDVILNLKNNTEKSIRINRNFLIHTDLKPTLINKETEENVMWLPPPFPKEVTEKSFYGLNPNETISVPILGLQKYLSSSESGGYLASGDYLLYIEYTSITEDFKTKKKFDAWNGSITSNTIEIKIK